ncbi:MAG: hypothetical protein QOH79_730 [Acidimicrobiaceae bacterium]
MARRGRTAAFAALLLVAGVVAASPVRAAPSSPSPSPGWPSRPSSHTPPKLSSDLDPENSISLENRTGAASAKTASALVQVKGPDVDAVRAAVEAVGGEVRTTSSIGVVANVDRTQLRALADDQRVAFVMRPQTLRPDVISEGVDNVGVNRLGATGAKAWQDAGRDGTGVKVAIVDVGFDKYTTESVAGRLPALPSIKTQNFCGPNMVGFDGRGPNGTLPPIDHGTAVAEIVHQMAPNATLYLVCVFTDADMTSAANYLYGEGVTIVNASIGDVLGGRGDGTGVAGTPAAAVYLGRQGGQLWSVASGNEALGHYQFSAFDRDNDGAVEINGGTPSPGPEGTETYSYTLAAGAVSNVGMKWDAWPTSNQTFDMCFFRGEISQLGLVGCQLGSPNVNATPTLRAAFPNDTGSAQTYFLVIFRSTAQTTITPRVDLYFQGQEEDLQAVRVDGSVSEPATSPFVMAVGAHCYANGSLEPFSGQGPTIDGRMKPDLSGPDGVSNDVASGVFSGFCNNHAGFYGTSAAAPHAAGAAALVKQAGPKGTPQQIQNLLMDRGADAGPPGPDNQYGHGRLNLGPLAFAYFRTVQSGAGAVSPSPGRTDVFVKGDDGGMWTRTITGSGLSQWTSLDGIITSDPDVSSWGGGRMDLFARGTDNALYHRWTGDGTNWANWERLGGVLTSGPTAVSWGPNRIDVFVRGTDNSLWTMFWNGSSWSGFIRLGGVLTADPDVASWGPNRLDVFVRGTDNGLWHQWWDGAHWSGFEGFGGVLSAGPTAVSWGLNRIDVAVRGSDAQMYVRSWNGSSWSGYAPRGGLLLSAPELASPGNGLLEAFGQGTDAKLYRQSFNGSWLGWTSLGPP